MKKLLVLLILALSPAAFAQTFGNVTMWMAQPASPVGTTITPTILGQYSLPGTGCPAGSWTITGTAPKVGVSQGSLGASITAGGITYPSTQPTNSIAFDDGSNFSYIMCGNVPGGSTMTIAGYYTDGFGTGVFSVSDAVRMDASTPNSFIIMQLQLNGATHCIRAHAGSSADTGPCIPITIGQRMFYNLTAQAGVGTTVRLYNATTFALIGSSFLASSGTAAIGTPFRWYLGNVEAATSAGHTDFFEDTMTSSASIILPASPACTQPWCGVVAASRAIDWSGAGVTGGIPDTSTWTQSGSTIAAYSGTPATINTALAACGANQFVQLGAGIFTLSDPIVVSNKQRCKLIGTGANQTIVKVAGGTTTCGTGVTCALVIRAGDANTSGTPSNTATWASGFTQGSTNINLGAQLTGSLANLKVGNYLFLDGIDDDALGCDNGGTWVAQIKTTCTVGTPTGTGVNGPYSGQGNGGGARANRAQQQMVKVVSCGTSTVGASCTSTALVISPGLYMANWSAAKTPQAWWATSPTQFFGVQNIQFDSTNNGISPAPNQCSAGVGISIYNSDNVWIQGVEGLLTGRAQVQINWGAHNTIRDSYFYGTQNRNSCSYGVEVFAGSDNLIENNIFQAITSPYMSNGPDAGSVFGYNYAPSTLYTAGSGFTSNDHGDHDAGNGFALIEGNIGGIVNADVIHGSANFDFYGRNYFRGLGTCYTGPADTTSTTTAIIASGLFGACTANTSPFVINAFHRGYNLIGNVVGTTGWNTGYQCVSTSTTATSCTTGSHPAFDLGGGNTGFSPAVPNDVNTVATVMRWGNIDSSHGFTLPQFVSSEVPSTLTGVQALFANPVPSTTTLPASFYYSSRPSWLPVGKAWPLIGPDVTGGNVSGVSGHVFTNPAQDCYIAMGGPANGVSTPLTFNAANCFSGGAPGNPVAQVLPASGTFAGQQLGTTSTPLVVTINNIGTASMTITSTSTTGDYAQSGSTCGATVAAGASCTVNVTFTPIALGTRSGSFIVNDNATGSPHTVALSGTGTQGLAQFAPISLTFGSQTVGSTSTSQPIVLTNNGTANLILAAIVPTGNFSQSNNCPLSPSTMAIGASCTISVTFTPSVAGTRTGAITVTSNGTGSPQTAPLSGTGQAPTTCGMTIPTAGITISGGGIQMSCPLSFNFGTSIDPLAFNGSACTGNGTPQAGCSSAFTALSTLPANTNAQTQVVDISPTPYSTVDVHSYLYSLATTRVGVHWQPWFVPSNGHISVGYNENLSTTVTAQLTAMKAIGIDFVVPDYYGNSSTKAKNLASVDAMAAVIGANPSLYPKMMLGMDSGAWSNAGQCPAGSGITTAQMEACIETQLDYAAVHYFFQSWYETEGGSPLVSFFLDRTDWPSVDWDATYAHVHAHVAAGQSCGSGCTYTASVLLLGRNSGDITQAGLDGSFAWSPTQTFNNASPGTQLQWNGTSSYLDNFYTIARANPTKIVMGLLYKGFDDANASFGTGKLIAQQCAQVFKLSGDKVGSSGYSSGSQLKRIQIQTWNDYEEGTEVETGVDNCFTVSASVAGTTLSWTITPTDATYSTLTTVDRLRVLYGSTGSFNIATDNITPTLSGSSSLNGIPPGVWTVYLQMVGRPMIVNHVSNAINYTSH